jgi:hypothetical protein
MRKVTGLLFLVCLVSGLMWGATDGKKYQDPMPMHPDTSAPDAWGYTWVKSTDPGGPTFNWVDIRTRGTLVTGLTDDNVVGPFDILFNFPYYWYSANRFKVGSNGYIQFDNTTTAFAPPFAAFPSTALPNDLMAICVGDLVFSGQAGAGGQCYYWTNSSDSLVVSFINVTEWESTIVPANIHTFQIILNRADSSITYQYGRQVGRYNTTNNTRLAIGIENATGQIGLQYAFSTTPPHVLMPDTGLAIKIKRTVNTGLQVTDAGIVGGLNATNLGEMTTVGLAKTIQCVVKNFGTAAITNAPVRYAITRTGQPSAFDTVIVPSLAAGQEVTVTFPRQFTPAVTGSYSALFNVTVPSDIGPGNNSKTAEITSSSFTIGQNTVVQYEGGVAGGSINWIGGGGVGVAFDLPPSAYPVRIESVYVSVASVTAQPMLVQILDGSTGSPGAVLAERTAVTAVVGMNGISFRSDSIRIPAGRRFFVGARGQIAFNYEITAPISFRSWEYTGGWAPYRSGDLQDVIIRASVQPYTPPGVTYNVPELLYYTFENSVPGLTPNTASAPVGTSPALITGHTLGTGGMVDTCLIGAAGTGANCVLPGWNWNVTGNWTIGFWVSNLLETLGGSPTYLFGDPGSGSFRCFYGGAALPNNIIFRGPFSATGWTVNVPMPGSYYIHLVWDGSAIVIYKDGVLVSTNPATNVMPTGTGFKFAGYSTSSYSLNVGGKLDEFRLYNRALDATEIRDTWNVTLPATVTDVKEVANVLPAEFELAQNYPNPFNPSTTIQFGLPVAADVTLKIYNVLGQEVITLFNGQRGAGTFQTVWNGRNSTGNQVASGMYFYNLIAKSADGKSTFTNIKKMLLLK